MTGQGQQSIFTSALGSDFARLSPALQEYFGLAAGGGTYLKGTGTFDVAGVPKPWLRPAFRAFEGDESFFGDYGTTVPFTVEAHAHLDPFRRPSLTMVRRIEFRSGTRIFRDTTILTPQGLIDYVGRSQRIATGVKAFLGPGNSFRSVSQKTRLFPALGPDVIRVPGPLDGRAYTWQQVDPGKNDFTIQVKVVHPVIGNLFLYSGSFDVEELNYPAHEAASHGVPNVLPRLASPTRWEAKA